MPRLLFYFKDNTIIPSRFYLHGKVEHRTIEDIGNCIPFVLKFRNAMYKE